MKIGFFTDSYLPEHHGVISSIESFKRGLEKRGHKVFIYAPEVPGYVDLPNVFRLKSFKVIRKPEMRLALPVAMPARIKEFLNSELDIAHAHSIFTLGLVAKVISKHKNIPMVYTHHTDYAEYAKFYLKEGYVSPFIASRLTASFSNHTDAVIAPSIKVKEYLEKIDVKKPISILPTGIDLSEFDKSDNLDTNIKTIKKELGIKENEFVLMYLGRVCEEKNIALLIESLAFIEKEVDNVKLLIIGDGPDMPRLKEIAKDLKLEDKVIFTGFIPKELKSAYYRLSNIFVFASKTDTQGIVILEAMASGLPILAVDDTAIRSMVKHGENGLLVEENPEIFAKEAVYLLKNRNISNKMSNSSKIIAKDFSEDKKTEELISLYERLISLKTSGK